MNLAQRFTLMVRGKTLQSFEKLEDPQASLEQLVLEMGSQLEAAKRAIAQAVANERRLRSRLERQQREADRFDASARNAVARADDALAREALRRAEQARRQADEVARQLTEQEADTTRIRSYVEKLQDRFGEARSKLQMLRARTQQTQARAAIGKVLQGSERVDLHAEFERLGEKIELHAAEEGAYLEIDDQLSGQDLRRRLDQADLEDSVESRLESLRLEIRGEERADTPGEIPEAPEASEAPETAENQGAESA
ncbi:MAG: PspA/IM30 family protein [Acidobacteriota bacterium]